VSHLGRRIKFTASEVDKLRSVFLKHAQPVQASRPTTNCVTISSPQQHKEDVQASGGAKPAAFEQEFDHERFGEGSDAHVAASSASPAPVAEHLLDSSGSELRLFVSGFAGVCENVCMSTGGVFGRFRERATVRTVSDVGPAGVLTHALFVGDPQLYTLSAEVSGQGEEDAGQQRAHQLPQVEDPEAQLDGEQGSAQGAAAVPHSFSFGEFLAHFYYLTKATIEEKLLYSLLISARRMQQHGKPHYQSQSQSGNSEQLAAQSPIPDVFSHQQHSSSARALSVSTLRSITAAFFCLHLGVLRHIMPLMAYHRAREMREQMEQQRAAALQRAQARAASPNAALLPPVPPPSTAAPVDPGVTALALLGLLEGVLSEAESAISETNQHISQELQHSAALAAAATSAATSAVPIEQWVSQWSSQAELLTLASVPALSTLISISSSVPIEHHDARTANKANTTASSSVQSVRLP